jgi:hypothetical protein
MTDYAWRNTVRQKLLQVWGEQACQFPKHWPDVLARLLKDGAESAGAGRSSVASGRRRGNGASAAFRRRRAGRSVARRVVRLSETGPAALRAIGSAADRGAYGSAMQREGIGGGSMDAVLSKPVARQIVIEGDCLAVMR